MNEYVSIIVFCIDGLSYCYMSLECNFFLKRLHVWSEDFKPSSTYEY